jgi:hypothetical protein
VICGTETLDSFCIAEVVWSSILNEYLEVHDETSSGAEIPTVFGLEPSLNLKIVWKLTGSLAIIFRLKLTVN